MTNYDVGERHNTNMFHHLIYILVTNYDVISENMGIHGPVLYIFKMLTMKKIELGFSVNKFLYGKDLKY